MDDILELDRRSMVAEGAERMVFVHPDDPTRLVKVHKAPEDRNRPLKMFRSDTGLRFAMQQWGIVRQYDEYNRLWLWQRFRENMHLPICHLYGFVKTNLGLGGITERVVDAQGGNGPTFRALSRDGLITDPLLEDFNRLVAALYDEGVCISDSNPANFVYGHRHLAGTGQRTGPEWVMVDGFGDRFAIPIRTWSKLARRRGTDRTFMRKFNAKGFVWNATERRVERAT